MDKIQEEKYFLKFLFNTTEQQQKILMKHLTKSQMDVLVEVIYNAIMENLTIAATDKKRLNRYRHVIRKVVSKGLSQRWRKALLLKYFKQIISLIKPCESWLRN